MTDKDARPPAVAAPEATAGTLVDQDAPLVGRAKRGDREAFSRLVERHHRRVFGTAHRMLGDREAAADITQDTFLAAWRALEGFEERARFSTWITKIAMNRCRNALRAPEAARTGPLLTDPPGDPARGPEAAVGDREVAAHLERALGRIDAEHREILVLREIEGLSYDAIAEILDLEAGTVKSRLHRARAALRERLRGVWPP
jgi:RNA polymerase sigma-70 factor (ECF subfamily)